MVNSHIAHFGIIPITIIIVSSMVVSVALTASVDIGIAHGQVSAALIAPQLKAAICNPSNPKLKVVNMTESKICGIPVTIKASTRSSANVAPTMGAAAITTSSSGNNNASQSTLSTFIP
jgi:hypothetical protein